MKKKGFTLIELLAVIIVLAIIALIATPTILNVVENSRKKAFEQTAIGYYNAAKYIYDEMYLDRNTEDVYFTFNNGEQVSSNENYQLKAKGDKPKGGLVYLTEEGSISVSIHNNKYCAMVEDDQKVRLSENIEECNFELTEVPKECYIIKSEKIIADNVPVDLQHDTYNMLYYDTTNTSCPQEFNTLILPSEVNGQVVEGIGDSVFSGKFIQKLYIPNSIMVIEAKAFTDNQLTSITIPENVLFLGIRVFANNSIKKVTYLAIDAYASDVGRSIWPFANNGVEEVTIGEHVITIPNRLFSNQAIKRITIPNSVTTIGNRAFNGNQLEEITIPAGVTTIGDYAFHNNYFENASAITIEGDATRFDSDWVVKGFPAK